MKPLSGLDAVFLDVETPNAPMNVLVTVVLDGPVECEQVLARLRDRVHQLPPFRRRLLPTPFGLAHPVWVDDPDFDLREHVFRVQAPEPGDERALEAVVARIARRRLDRAKPLWELGLIEGLAHGRCALVVKAHHAAVDGVSGAASLLHLFDREGREQAEEPAGEPEPSAVALLGHGLTRLCERPSLYWDVLRRAGRSAADISRSCLGADAAQQPVWPFQAPASPWNGPLSAGRSVAYARTPLAAVDVVRGAFGGTVNDVVLTACARALRAELLERGGEPREPLVAAVPVSTRRADDTADCGNRISAFLTRLPVELEDPVHQLGDVRRATREAKRFHARLGPHTLGALAEVLPGFLPKAAELYSRWRLAGLHRPLVNLVLSNVPGPPWPLSFCGQPVRALHPHGPLMEGVGLNVTVLSYAGSLDIGVLACREHLPDAHRLTDRIAGAVEELAKLAEAALPEIPDLARRVA